MYVWKCNDCMHNTRKDKSAHARFSFFFFFISSSPSTKWLSWALHCESLANRRGCSAREKLVYIVESSAGRNWCKGKHTELRRRVAHIETLIHLAHNASNSSDENNNKTIRSFNFSHKKNKTRSPYSHTMCAIGTVSCTEIKRTNIHSRCIVCELCTDASKSIVDKRHNVTQREGVTTNKEEIFRGVISSFQWQRWVE